jgi:hypothetical protein
MLHFVKAAWKVLRIQLRAESAFSLLDKEFERSANAHGRESVASVIVLQDGNIGPINDKFGGSSSRF